ncbi:MAG TPA: hypothetical protein VFQ53_02520 [Kofleriaceae bacterium]|nr:hypothetical protein [Kofleriaceae bacterium]
MTDELRRAGATLGDPRSDREARRNAASLLRAHLRTLPEMATRIAALDAETPIVLFPVRLETKLRRTRGLELLVRIYPDSIVGPSHEPALTAAEVAAGHAYWQLAWQPGRELDAWRALAVGRRPPRAAWIAKQLEPVNLADRPHTPPVFPDVARREAAWTEPVQARLLPDRWIVRVFAQGRVMAVESQPIVEPLALTLDPNAREEDLVTFGEGLRIDAESAWTLDFARAREIGMAVVVPLDAQLARIDQVVCVGVKTTLDPDATASALAELLEAHHFGRGLALVPQGTPTNNTDDAAAGDRELDAEASFRVERGAALVSPGSDGAIVAATLGVPDATFAHVAHSDGREQRSARAMSRALWPCTLGYYLEQMMSPVFDRVDQQTIRAYVTEHVRGRGSCSAIRVGATPYGVLPVASLARWPQGAESDRVAGALPDSLRTLRGIWSAATARVARIRRTGDGAAELLGVLGLDASARSIWVRRALGQDALWNLFGLLDVSIDDWLRGQRVVADQILDQIAHRDWDPRVLTVTFDEEPFRFTGALVDPHPDEQRTLEPNYIRALRSARWLPLRKDTISAKPLLYRMLRQGLLLELDADAFPILHANRRVTATERREPELVGIVARTEHRLDAWQRLESVVPEASNRVPLGEHLLDVGPRTSQVRAALAELEDLPTAELQRLFTETLDISSHRLDAWISSLAARRLASLRAQRRASYVGAYGYVEDLVTRDAGEQLGFIQTPSLDHATTAAVLRNAFAARLDATDGCAVDLSSRRVRHALELLEAARRGQPLGAVLGYRIERGLHEGHPTLELDKYIEPLRALYPLVAKKSGDPDDAAEPSESIGARNVVDGLAARTAWKAGTVPFGASGLPGSGDDRTAIEDELRVLDDAVDAVADLLLAESVHQLVRGNAAAASASLGALARGERPAEPEVVMQPRSGIDLMHRVLVVLDDDGPAPGWPAQSTPRAALEPAADVWIGRMLGDPRRIKLGVGPRVLDLASLALRPLDLLWLAGDDAELAARIRAAADSAGAAIEHRPALADRATERTLGDALVIARALAHALGGARPLKPVDFVRPETELPADPLAAEAMTRAVLARDRLRAATEALATATGAARIAALRGVADHGIAGVFPSPGTLLDELVVRARSEAERRLAAADRATAASDIVSAVFGRDAVFLPRLTVPNGAALDTALAARDAIGATRSEVRRWAQGVARVREPLVRWRSLALVTGAFGRDDLEFDVAQLPHGGRWIALPFAGDDRPPPGTISIAALRPGAASLANPISGFALDEWSEVVPSARQNTGIAVHHDGPDAEAPQALLVAVAPPTVPWSADLLVETVRETIELAKVRAVDGDLLGTLGQLLPTVFLPANSTGNALGVRFTAELEAAATQLGEP